MVFKDVIVELQFIIEASDFGGFRLQIGIQN